MSKSNTFETALLELIFNATPIAGLADNAAAAPVTDIYVSLHTADPDEAGDQTTNECAYTGYARMAVARTAGGWVVTGNSVSPVAAIEFPECTAGPETVTHLGVGTAASGAGVLLYSGPLAANIAVVAATVDTVGTSPTLKADTAITED